MAEDRLKNPFWLKKMKHQFSCLDVNKNGLLSAEDFEGLANNWVTYGNLKHKDAENIRKKVLAFWPGISNGKETITEEEFIISLSSVLGGKIAFLRLINF